MSTPVNEIVDRLALLESQVITDEERQAHVRAYDEQQRRTKITDLRHEWGAPTRHLRCTPDRSGEWGTTFQKLSEKLGSGFLIALIGGRGSGKTQLGVTLMHEATEKLMTARFTSCMGIFMAFKATYRKDAEMSEAKVLSLFAKPQLLVVDEIGKRGQTDWENGLLFELFNTRYNAMRDTLLTSNQTAAEFQESLGPSLVSRMRETGGVIDCEWPSFRV